MADKQLMGWRVRSAVPLPDLLDWTGDDRDPDIRIRLADDLSDGAGWCRFSPAVWIGPANEMLLRIPDVAAFLVEGGNLVTIQPVMPVDAPDIRAFLLGTVLAVLCFNRGVLPLHASAVEMAGGAVLVAGNSGLGKSSLAAEMHRRGARLLSDDLCALDFQGREQPLVWPAFPRMKLWRDSAEHLGLPTGGAEQSRAELEKYHIVVASDGFRAEPSPISLLVVLERHFTPQPFELVPIHGLAAMQQRHVVHRWRLGEALGHGALIFHGLAALARSVPMVGLRRPDGLGHLSALADAVTAQLGLGRE